MRCILAGVVLTLMPPAAVIAVVLLSATASAQSNLPPCPSDKSKGWTKCFGTYTFANGEKYVGEYLDSKHHGQGTYTWPSGEKHVGEYRNGKMHGPGTHTWPDGERHVGEFRDGKAVAGQSLDGSVRQWRLLAEQGDAAAQVMLGAMYGRGRSVPQDYAEAVKWYRLAAEQGSASGQYGLGLCYLAGNGVPQDYVLAHMWSNLAVSRFPASEAKSRNLAIEVLDTLASLMTPEQIAEAQKMAREWRPK